MTLVKLRLHDTTGCHGQAVECLFRLHYRMRLLKKSTLFWGNLQNSVPKGFIGTPIHVMCVNFVKCGLPEIGKVVRYLPHKKFRLALASAWIASKICHGQRQTVCSECLKFHPNRFTSGGVITERVNTVQTRHKVFTIVGEATASSPSK